MKPLSPHHLPKAMIDDVLGQRTIYTLRAGWPVLTIHLLNPAAGDPAPGSAPTPETPGEPPTGDVAR